MQAQVRREAHSHMQECKGSSMQEMRCQGYWVCPLPFAGAEPDLLAAQEDGPLPAGELTRAEQLLAELLGQSLHAAGSMSSKAKQPLEPLGRLSKVGWHWDDLILLCCCLAMHCC